MALGQKTPGEVSVQLDLNNVTIRQITTIPVPEEIRYLSRNGSVVGFQC